MMNFGFNQNVSHNGEVYHVQTEDGGTKNPVITTLLFKGGTVVASKKTSYADILTSDRLVEVVRDIMKEQHSVIVKELLSGRYDGGGR